MRPEKTDETSPAARLTAAGLFAALVVSVPSVALVGCAGSQGQLTQCQTDKEQLLATIREQRDEVSTLRTQTASLESRLSESEKELARLDPSRALPQESSPDDPLEWRPHRALVSRENPEGRPAGSLAALAQRDGRLQFDRRSGMARVRADVTFQGDTPALTAEGRQALDDLAKMLRTGDGAELQIVVTGYGPEAEVGKTATGRTAAGRRLSPRQLALARAQTVADYLDRHGIAGDRLAVASVAAEPGEMASGGVGIVLAEPEGAVVLLPGKEQQLRR